MSDPTPTPSSFPGGDWLLAMFNQLEARLTAHGRRMDDGFAHNETKLDALNQKFDDHALADAEMAKDIALIKQARQIEAQTLSRRGAARLDCRRTAWRTIGCNRVAKIGVRHRLYATSISNSIITVACTCASYIYSGF